MASNLCLVLTQNEEYKDEYPVNLQFYNWFFEAIRKQLVADLADGTSKLTIRDDDLNAYYIEYIPIEEQDKFVKDYVEPLRAIQKKLEAATSSLTEKMTELL